MLTVTCRPPLRMCSLMPWAPGPFTPSVSTDLAFSTYLSRLMRHLSHCLNQGGIHSKGPRHHLSCLTEKHWFTLGALQGYHQGCSKTYKQVSSCSSQQDSLWWNTIHSQMWNLSSRHQTTLGELNLTCSCCGVLRLLILPINSGEPQAPTTGEYGAGGNRGVIFCFLQELGTWASSLKCAFWC